MIHQQPPRPLVEAPLLFRMSSGGEKAKQNSLAICPKCDAPAFIRRSTRVTEKVKHLDAHCTNTGCGHTFGLELVFRHTYCPGLIERPDLDLPICPRDQVPHVLPPARDAGDDPNQLTMFAGG